MFGFLDNLSVNKGLMLLLCAIAFALACVQLCMALRRGKIYARGVITTACKAVIVVAVAFLLGYGVALLPLQPLTAKIVYYALLLIVTAACAAIYMVGKKRAVRLATANALRKSAGSTAIARHAWGWYYGTCFALVVFAAVMLALGRADYYMPMFPVAVAVVAALLGSLFAPRLWYALATLVILVFFALSLGPQIAQAQMSSLCIVAPALASSFMLAVCCATLTLKK